MKSVLLRSKNTAATEFYYDIIRDALNQCSELIYDGFEEQDMPKDKDALILVGSSLAMRRVWRRGYHNIVTWFQGDIAAESFLRHHDPFRKTILEWFDKFALRHSRKVIFVSEAMKKHYEARFHWRIDQAYIMPCFNTDYHPERVTCKDYSQRIFTYTGGLSKWQCIDQTLMLYKRIEESSDVPTKLLLLTPAQEEAKELIAKYGIQNAEVGCVHYSELPNALAPVTFGFALREDNDVNRVATPTKLANYLSNGIIPIYTKCIEDFYHQSINNPFQIALDDVNHISNADIQRIMNLIDSELNGKKIDCEFRNYFKEYYNRVWHVNHIAQWLVKD